MSKGLTYMVMRDDNSKWDYSVEGFVWLKSLHALWILSPFHPLIVLRKKQLAILVCGIKAI